MAAYCKKHSLNYETFMYHESCMKKKENFNVKPNAFIQLDVPEKIRLENYQDIQ